MERDKQFDNNQILWSSLPVFMATIMILKWFWPDYVMYTNVQRNIQNSKWNKRVNFNSLQRKKIKVDIEIICYLIKALV